MATRTWTGRTELRDSLDRALSKFSINESILNSKHFVDYSFSWRPKKKLLYKISKYPTKRLSEQEVNEAMEEAFKVWSDVADLEFERVTDGEADIDILFVRREHRDGDPFDGRGIIMKI